MADSTLKADDMIQEIKRAGIRFIVALPEPSARYAVVNAAACAAGTCSFEFAKALIPDT